MVGPGIATELNKVCHSCRKHKFGCPRYFLWKNGVTKAMSSIINPIPLLKILLVNVFATCSFYFLEKNSRKYTNNYSFMLFLQGPANLTLAEFPEIDQMVIFSLIANSGLCLIIAVCVTG